MSIPRTHRHRAMTTGSEPFSALTLPFVSRSRCPPLEVTSEGERWLAIQDCSSRGQPLSRKRQCTPSLFSATSSLCRPSLRVHITIETTKPAEKQTFISPQSGLTSQLSTSGRILPAMEPHGIPSRELPSLDPPLNPHCFHRKLVLDRPPSLPLLTTNEAGPINGPFMLAPATSNLRGSRDLNTEVSAVHCEPSPGVPSREVGKLESESYTSVLPGNDVHRAPAHEIRSAYPSACSRTVPTSWDRVSSSTLPDERFNSATPLSTGLKRKYFNVYENGVPRDVGYRKEAARSRPIFAAPYLPGHEVVHPAHIRGDSSRDFRKRPISPTTFTALDLPYDTDSLIPTQNVNPYEPAQASSYPPRYSEYPVKAESAGSSDRGGWGGDGRKGKDREDDDRWQRGDSGGDERSGDGGADEDEDDDKEDNSSKKKVPKKTAMACHFCRRRKLKCDGGRPTCSNCARRSLACAYDESVRRRGPGRKNKSLMMQQQEQAQNQLPQASASTTSLASTLPMYSEVAPQLFNLPAPPRPSYNFPVGRIPSMGQQPSQAGPSNVYGRQQRQPETYSQPTQHIQRSRHEGHSYQQLPLQPPQYEQQYSPSYAPAQGSGQLSHTGSGTYRGRSVEDDSEDEEDEGTSGSRSKRRASSPAEDIDPTRRKRRRED